MDGPATLSLLVLPVVGGLGLYVALTMRSSPVNEDHDADGGPAREGGQSPPGIGLVGTWPERVRLAAAGGALLAFGGLLFAGSAADDWWGEMSWRAIAARVAGWTCIAAAVAVVVARRTRISVLAFAVLAASAGILIALQGAVAAGFGLLALLAGAVALPLWLLVRRSEAAHATAENGLESETLLACAAGTLLLAAFATTAQFVLAEEAGRTAESGRWSVLPASWPSAPSASNDASPDIRDEGKRSETGVFGRVALAVEAFAVLVLVSIFGAMLMLRRADESLEDVQDSPIVAREAAGRGEDAQILSYPSRTKSDASG